MSITESVIREMKAFHRDSCYPECGDESAADAARRVILALAENLPDSAVKKAWEAFSSVMANRATSLLCTDDPMHAAIIAALKDIAGESP